MALTLEKENFLEGEVARTIAQTRIQKGLYGGLLIEKGGEGSRGGKVIGHTKSGKPVYGNKTVYEHKGFTDKEHQEAEEILDKHIDKKIESGKKKFLGNSKDGVNIYEGAKVYHPEHGEGTAHLMSTGEVHVDTETGAFKTTVNKLYSKPVKTKEEIDKEQKEKHTKDIINGKEERKGLSKAFESLGIGI